MIELKNLTKKFADFTAVDNLNISIPKGEIFGFIGPNGAGKTTTIMMMGGILVPTAGTVTIAGIRMDEYPEKAKRKIGFIPDRPYLYEKLTGMEFLKFTADLYGVDEKTFFKKAEEKLSLFSLTDWPDELIESYSHGMKQRLIMAAALIHEPEIIIVDEPTVGLDPVGIRMLKDLFKQLAAQNITIFVSTHNLKVAEDICNRIGIIRKGKLIATGTTKDLRRETQVTDADLEQVFFMLMTETVISEQ